jgi:hypothetical protein
MVQLMIILGTLQIYLFQEDKAGLYSFSAGIQMETSSSGNTD